MSEESKKNERDGDQQEPSIPDPSELLKPLVGDLSYEVRKGSEQKDTNKTK